MSCLKNFQQNSQENCQANWFDCTPTVDNNNVDEHIQYTKYTTQLVRSLFGVYRYRLILTMSCWWL